MTRFTAIFLFSSLSVSMLTKAVYIAPMGFHDIYTLIEYGIFVCYSMHSMHGWKIHDWTTKHENGSIECQLFQYVCWIASVKREHRSSFYGGNDEVGPITMADSKTNKHGATQFFERAKLALLKYAIVVFQHLATHTYDLSGLVEQVSIRFKW